MAGAAPRAETSMWLMEVRTASHTTKNTLLPGISLDLEIVPNLRPKKFWLKVRTRGSQPSTCVPTFSQFTNKEILTGGDKEAREDAERARQIYDKRFSWQKR